TAAIGKGFAIGSAAFAALALIVSYIWGTAGTADEIVNNPVINLVEPYTLIGILIGGMLPFFFTSLLIKGVADTANLMIVEIRRQFKEIPGIRTGEAVPDYKRCIEITTKGAVSRMLTPGIVAIASPFIVGFLFGRSAVAGLLMGGLSSAIMIAIFSANAGGAWDNAKKYIETGEFGGKGTPTHEAAVVGDTVGDPLKDTVGPSMDILIKLMSVVSLVFGSLFPVTPFFM
ncbi:MAG: sodium/proton-translocating pyrophosphatase, partial [Mesotoga sp.]|nr:sodium/proton-translocating pyrophosphatase [Mesotoga sp.]